MLRQAFSIALILFAPILFALPAFALDGSLEVTEGALKVVRTDGFKARFYAGKYPAQVTFNNGKLYLTVTRKDVRTDAELTLPRGTTIPANGTIAIDGVKAGQAFNVDGTIATDVKDSPKYNDYEACTYYRREWVCEGYGRDEYCRWEDVPVRGDREVEYYFQTKTVTYALNFPSPGEGKARFGGQATSTKKIYTYEGRCR